MRVDVSRYPAYCKEQGKEPNLRCVKLLDLYASRPDEPDTRPRHVIESDVLLKAAEMDRCELEIFLECALFLLSEQKKARRPA